MNASRWIAHIDMDSFYVSVERLRNPKLNGLPVVVGGKGPRAVVASASYEARKYGVRSAMPMGQARRLCHRLVIVEPDFSKYFEISNRIFDEMKKIAPVVEQVSVDEAFLDLTGCERLYRSREESGRIIKETVKKTSGLTSTIAIGTNKIITKIGSDFAKPNGLIVVAPGEESRFLAPLSVRKLPGVGPKTSLVLENAGVHLCSDLVAKSPDWLRKNIGEYGLSLIRMAQGIDDSPVVAESERKSLGSEETFDEDISSTEILDEKLRNMSEELAFNLREEGLLASTVQIKFRYPDFSTFTRAQTLNEPTQMADVLLSVGRSLLRKNKPNGLSLRLLGLSVRNFIFSDGAQHQLDLFVNEELQIKKNKVAFLKDELRKKFGKGIF